MKYTFQISNSCNAEKRKICFILYSYQTNYIIESPPKYIYGFSDIDECKGNYYCHLNASCTNTDRSYVCECQPGFNGNGQNCKGEFNPFATIFRIFLLESSLKLLRWPLSAILLVCHL